jgi:hypothetical protein
MEKKGVDIINEHMYIEDRINIPINVSGNILRTTGNRKKILYFFA